jgi:hypothetical protein
MPTPSVTNKTSVLAAINEFDQIGRTEFLTKYGYGKAKEYFLVHKGKSYDSKAILGVAHGIDHNIAALKFDDFSGGDIQVKKKLEKLGFIVRVNSPEELPPLILVENEVTATESHGHWLDITGESYHFPNQYLNKFKEGRKFIYYRGTRRKNKIRGTPEYFGYGRIGHISPDPANANIKETARKKWFCKIENYIPFSKPVEFKLDGKPFESITQNQWGVGVRVIDQEVYDLILRKAGLIDNEREITGELLNIPDVAEVMLVPMEGESLLSVTKLEQNKKNTVYGHYQRRSKFSKLIGDHAEHIVFHYLQNILNAAELSTLRWVANEGETPGWDIEYISNHKKHLVEVKGTQGNLFSSVEITANEWKAAEEYKNEYYLYLITNCTSKDAKFQIIQNPFSLVEKKSMKAIPQAWQLILIE